MCAGNNGMRREEIESHDSFLSYRNRGPTQRRFRHKKSRWRCRRSPVDTAESFQLDAAPQTRPKRQSKGLSCERRQGRRRSVKSCRYHLLRNKIRAQTFAGLVDAEDSGSIQPDDKEGRMNLRRRRRKLTTGIRRQNRAIDLRGKSASVSQTPSSRPSLRWMETKTKHAGDLILVKYLRLAWRMACSPATPIHHFYW